MAKEVCGACGVKLPCGMEHPIPLFRDLCMACTVGGVVRSAKEYWKEYEAKARGNPAPGWQGYTFPRLDDTAPSLNAAFARAFDAWMRGELDRECQQHPTPRQDDLAAERLCRELGLVTVGDHKPIPECVRRIQQFRIDVLNSVEISLSSTSATPLWVFEVIEKLKKRE